MFSRLQLTAAAGRQVIYRPYSYTVGRPKSQLVTFVDMSECHVYVYTIRVPTYI